MEKKNRSAFTLMELIVVIAALALLSSIFIVYLNNFLEKGRDTQRLSDVNQISNAIKMFYRDEGFYPLSVTPGESLIGSTTNTVYLTEVPSNPSPRIDGDCPNEDYVYSLVNTFSGRTGYNINFCLGGKSSEAPAGASCLTENGLTSDTNVCSEGAITGLQLWLKADTGISLSGSNVTAWDDQSGNDYDCSQSTATYQPTINSVDGLDAILFDGNNDYLLGEIIPQINEGPYTSFIVFDGLGYSGDIFRPILCMNNNNNFGWTGDGYYDAIFFLMSNYWSSYQPNQAAGYWSSSFEKRLAAFTKDKLIINSTDVYSWTSDLQTTYTPNVQYIIGASLGDYGGSHHGNVYEIMLFNRTLSDEEIEEVENYLNNKYDIY